MLRRIPTPAWSRMHKTGSGDARRAGWENEIVSGVRSDHGSGILYAHFGDTADICLKCFKEYNWGKRLPQPVERQALVNSSNHNSSWQLAWSAHRKNIRNVLRRKDVEGSRTIDTSRLPTTQKGLFSLGTLSGAFDSKFLPTSQRGVDPDSELGAG